MISHFVRMDAKNWDEYVMAYQAMPHCSTKYSPYSLVFGREMRLPIEDDWNPHLVSNKTEENEYEEHVRMLAERLCEANKAASQQWKNLRKEILYIYMILHTKGVKLGNFHTNTKDHLKLCKRFLF